jgi:type VI secretion system secreted protein Hcp
MRLQTIPRRALKIALPTLAALGAGAAVGIAAIPSADGSIHACFSNTDGAVRIIDVEAPTSATCPVGETAISWGQQGPTGATGATGATGPTGPAGPKGDTGPAGTTGPQGAAGLTGDAGAAGASGSSSSDNSGTTSSSGSTTQAGGPSADMFLKLDGIAGDSTDDKHKNEIDVTSFAFAVGRGGDGTGSAGRGAAGRAHLQTLRINKVYDASSPKLFRAAATGQHIKSAVMTFRRGSNDVLTYALTDVQVTSYDQGGTDGDARDLGSLEEEVGLTAAKVHVTEQSFKLNGDKGAAVTADWNVRARAK